MLYVGLTGNIASGKSTVAHRLEELGATVVDADSLARQVVSPGSPAFDRVVERWGPEFVNPDGSLDRAALRHVVFSDQEQLEELNQIIHPVINRLRRKMVADARKRGDAVLVYDAPLLFERRLAHDFDAIILVDAPKPLRLERIVTTRDVPVEDAANMIASQMPAELKRARADYIIENDGSLQHLYDQVDNVWKRLTAQTSRPSLAV
jgi:dephospho-CoA kinase